MREGKYKGRAKRFQSGKKRRLHICDGCCNTCRHCFNYCGGACDRKIAKHHSDFVLREQLSEVVENQDLVA